MADTQLGQHQGCQGSKQRTQMGHPPSSSFPRVSCNYPSLPTCPNLCA